MDFANELKTIADNTPKVYEAGKNAEREAFWQSFTVNGTRKQYRYACFNEGWNDTSFNPPDGLIVPNDARYMFENTGITHLYKRQVDFSKATDLRQVFNTSTSIRYVECFDISSSNAGLGSTFGGCTNLETLTMQTTSDKFVFASSTFTNCVNLTHLTLVGTITTNGFNVQWCEKLTKDSIYSIFNALSTTTSALSITLSKTAVNNAFGIDVDDETTYPEGSEYYQLRHSRDNWSVNYI